MSHGFIASQHAHPVRWPASVWRAGTDQPAHYAPLKGEQSVEVAIIGAGFTGLACAAALADKGIECAVLDAAQPGYGASGRNGGVAVTRYKLGWAAIRAAYGEETMGKLYRLILAGVDQIEQLTERHGLQNHFQRQGHLTPASSPRAAASLQADADILKSAFGDSAVRILDRDETATRLGTRAYHEGYFDPRSAGIHPYLHATGLARALSAAGIPIYGDTPVLSVVRDGSDTLLHTPLGTLRARKLVYSTNGYTDMFPIQSSLARRVVAVSSAVLATAPLPPALAQRILPDNVLVTDTRHLVNYFRKTPDGHLLFGGRGSLTGVEKPQTYHGLEQKLVETFPELAGFPIDYRWSGKVAVTLDDFPHIGAVGDHAYFALGYGGRGVVLSHLLGSALADCVLGQQPALGPMSDNAFNEIPFHRFRVPGMNIVASYYKIKDRLGV